MKARLGTSKDRKKALEICSKSGMEIKGSNLVTTVTDPKALPGKNSKVLSIAMLGRGTYSFLYNPEYWEGL